MIFTSSEPDSRMEATHIAAVSLSTHLPHHLTVVHYPLSPPSVLPHSVHLWRLHNICFVWISAFNKYLIANFCFLFHGCIFCLFTSQSPNSHPSLLPPHVWVRKNTLNYFSLMRVLQVINGTEYFLKSWFPHIHDTCANVIQKIFKLACTATKCKHCTSLSLF